MPQERSRCQSRTYVLCILWMTGSASAGPFVTGASGMVDFGLTIATPIAILIIIGLGIAAAVGKISWGWVIGAIVGIAAVFGSSQIVEWIRDLFAV